MFEESGGEIHGRTDKRDRASRRRADDANCDLSDVEAEARLNDMPVARWPCGERRPMANAAWVACAIDAK